MGNIKLTRLKLENFKGFAARTFDFGGRNAAIYGANGAGKSTIYNAVTWLLFDKIAADDGTVMAAPDVKPQNDAGEVLDHAAVTSVEGVFDVDGEEITLKRDYFELWKKTRGKDKSVMSGHTSEYFWNDVPVQLNEFQTRLKDWIPDENLFWTLSNVHWFCRGMDWKKRRELLTEVCGLPDDRTILNANQDRFGALASGLGDKSLSDYRTYLDAQIKKLNAAQKTFPARLDEVKKSIQDLSGIDFGAARISRDAAEEKINQRVDELSRLDNGTLISQKKNELESVRNQINALKLENQNFRQSQMIPVENRRPEIEENLKRWSAELARNQRQKASDKTDGTATRARITALGERYKTLSASVFTAVSCPTCGQTLPPDAQERARIKFDQDKAQKMKDICAEAGREKERLQSARERWETADKLESEAREKVASLTDELADYIPPAAPEISDLPDYDGKIKSLADQRAILESEIHSIEQRNAAVRENINQILAQLRENKKILDEQIAKESVLEYYQRREEELNAEASARADELDALEGQRTLCEEYIRFKCGYIENAVNQRFRTVKFKLFQQQVNGGLKDCCDVYVGAGRLDHGLNTGAAYNAGIDIIDVLSRRYAVRVPLFVDGAESVSDPLSIDTQVIRMAVSRMDTELRLEVE